MQGRTAYVWKSCLVITFWRYLPAPECYQLSCSMPSLLVNSLNLFAFRTAWGGIAISVNAGTPTKHIRRIVFRWSSLEPHRDTHPPVSKVLLRSFFITLSASDHQTFPILTLKCLMLRLVRNFKISVRSMCSSFPRRRWLITSAVFAECARGQHSYSREFTGWGIFWGICCFPCGLICLL